MANKYKVWRCALIVAEDAVLPDAFDFPPRQAVISSVETAGVDVVVCFSGWSGDLTEREAQMADTQIEAMEDLE